jgi:hypothetical protein
MVPKVHLLTWACTTVRRRYEYNNITSDTTAMGNGQLLALSTSDEFLTQPERTVRGREQQQRTWQQRRTQNWKSTTTASSPAPAPVPALGPGPEPEPEAAPAPAESRFFSVPLLKAAGIGVDDKEHIFYKRAAVSKLLKFVDDAMGRYGYIDGLPGTGKSLTLWYKILCLAEKGATVTWIHFDRLGIVSKHIKLHYEHEYEHDYGQAGLVIENKKLFRRNELAEKIEEADTGILVLDGIDKEIFKDCVTSARIWKDEDEHKTVFLTMSNIMKRLHPHEEKAFGLGLNNYCTQHSWTMDEFKRAFIDDDGRRSRLFNENIKIFKQEWEIEEDFGLQELARRTTRKCNREGRKKFASVLEIVSQKCFVCGGSARWMLEMTRPEIEDTISEYLGTAESVSSILSFDLGPTSSAANTQMYYSEEYPGASGKSITVYTIVSQRATQLLVEKTGSGAVQMLYAQAKPIGNLAFLGWVVEADYFSRCKHNTLILLKKDNLNPTKFECRTGAVVEFDCAHLKLLQSYDEASTLRDAVQHLIPTVAGEANSKIGKPLAWNQGGYDVVRIEMAIEANGYAVLHLRFGQVTKSRTCSLKLHYFYEFTKFLVDANHVIASIEIGLIVPATELDEFKITHAHVTGAGLLDAFPVYAAADKTKWAQSKEQDQIVVYGLDTEK